ncbi:hypothetical protein J6590_049353 [Homalodisca vitripennis]|nr:hypothetical protein J6590_049353 [Homalodisca vitripennis]
MAAGRKENNYVLYSLMHFLLKTETKVETIQLVFSVRDHSFLPADRVFGRIEKLLRKRTSIELSCKDGCFIRMEGISGIKKVLIEKEIKIKGNNTVTFLKVEGPQCFNFESEAETWKTQKKGWHIDRCKRFELRRLPLEHISAAKKKDVIKLLEIIFGEEWQTDERLEWYKSMLLTNNEEHEHVQDDDSEGVCDCLENDCGLHI